MKNEDTMSLESSLLQNHLTAWLLRRTAESNFRRVAPVSAGVASEIGNVRKENQDRVAIARGKDRLGRVFVVAALADGIGGMRGGAECAAMTLGTFLGCVSEEAQSTSDDALQWLLCALQRANQAVYSKFGGNGGSTLVAVILREGGRAHWLSVGDSRVYSSKGSTLLQLSVDDTIAGQLGKPAKVDHEQSKLLQFIGIGESLEPHIEPLNVALIESVLLTSDGVHFLAPAPDWLGLVVGNASEPGLCVRRLTELSKWCGGPDNASAAMVIVASAASAETAPVYKCFEVWDPFGETQIITDFSCGFATDQSLLASPAPSLVGVPSMDVSVGIREGNHHPVSDAERSIPSSKPTKTRRTSGSRKPKPSGQKGLQPAKDKSASDVPQLVIEFTNKAV